MIEAIGRPELPPVFLTFLAPAKRCNQRRPSCVLTEVTREPVRSFHLTPDDYARFVAQFVAAQVPILTISFQGYEVTLPQSWPYVEAVFRLAQEHRVDRSFITNGMLLWKWTDRLVDLAPSRVSVSLDGTSSEVNDAIRGLPGALSTALASLRRLLDQAPDFAQRLAVVSCLYHEKNFCSLLDMPRLLRDLGIPRWAVSFEVAAKGREVRPTQPARRLRQWVAELQAAANDLGIMFHINDELEMLASDEEGTTASLELRHFYDPRFLYRMDPLGTVRSGEQLGQVWDPARAPRWDPEHDDAVEVVDYWNAVDRHLECSRFHDPNVR